MKIRITTYIWMFGHQNGYHHSIQRDEFEFAVAIAKKLKRNRDRP